MTAASSTQVVRPEVAGPLTAEELAAWRGMLKVHAHVTQQLDAELRAARGLSVSAYEVLMFLADAPGRRMRMSDLADRILLSRSGCTRLVDRLAAAGLVRRCAADGDGRGLDAQLTEDGVHEVEVARAIHLAGVRRHFLARLTATDEIALGDIWRRFGAAGVRAS